MFPYCKIADCDVDILYYEYNCNFHEIFDIYIRVSNINSFYDLWVHYEDIHLLTIQNNWNGIIVILAKKSVLLLLDVV